MRASPPVVVCRRFERRDWLLEDGYKGGRSSPSNSIAGHWGPGSSLSHSSTYPHGAGSNSDDYECSDWGSLADDESFWAPPTPLVSLPQGGAHCLLHPAASRLLLPWSARWLLLHLAAFWILLPRLARWLLVVPLLRLLRARAWMPRSLYRLIGSPSLPSSLGMTISTLATLSCSGSAPPAFPLHWMTRF